MTGRQSSEVGSWPSISRLQGPWGFRISFQGLSCLLTRERCPVSWILSRGKRVYSWTVKNVSALCRVPSLLHLAWAPWPWASRGPSPGLGIPGQHPPTPTPMVWLDSSWVLPSAVWLMTCYYMLHASLIALMSWKSVGGTAKIYSFCLGKLPPVKAGINWVRHDSAQRLLIASNKDHESPRWLEPSTISGAFLTTVYVRLWPSRELAWCVSDILNRKIIWE